MTQVHFLSRALLGTNVTIRVTQGTHSEQASVPYFGSSGEQHIWGKVCAKATPNARATGVAGLTVFAKDNGTTVGSATTDDQGAYDIAFATETDVTLEIDQTDLAARGLELEPTGPQNVFAHDTRSAVVTPINNGFVFDQNALAIQSTAGGTCFNSADASYATTEMPYNNVLLMTQLTMSDSTRANPQLSYNNGDQAIIDVIDPVKFVPGSYVAGYDRINMTITTMANADFNAAHPLNGDYLIRHNLPAGFSVILGGSIMANGTPTDTEIPVSISAGGNGTVTIESDTQGATLPADWHIEMVKVSNIAAYDNVGGTYTNAQQIFIPEFLAEVASWNPSYYRFMKAGDTEAVHLGRVHYKEIADLPTRLALNCDRFMPLEYMVALCNHVECDLWLPFWHKAKPALITHCAEYIRDHLDKKLKAYFEEYNEAWNNGYQGRRYYGGLSLFKYNGTMGSGLGSVAKNNNISVERSEDGGATGNGKFANLGQVVLPGDQTGIFTDRISAPSVAMRDPNDPDNDAYAWAVEYDGYVGPAAVYDSQSDTTTLRVFPRPDTTWTDAEWCYGDPYVAIDDAFSEQTVRMAKLCIEAFERTGERHRVNTVMGCKLNDVNQARRFMDPPNWKLQADFLDPMDWIDVLTSNPYFGTGLFQNEANETTNAVDAFIWAETNWTRDQINDAYRDILTYGATVNINGQDISEARGLHSVAVQMKAYYDYCESIGKVHNAYEGGIHVVHKDATYTGETDAEKDAKKAIILQQVIDFINSPQGAEMFTYWAELHVRYCHAAVMQFPLMGFWNPTFGVFSLLPTYGYDGSTDGRYAALTALKDADPWWLPQYPPRATAIENQNWTTSSTASLDLADYVSHNGKQGTFTGTPPAGMTLSGSKLLGTPQVAGTGTYSFTVANQSGSTTLSLPVTVTG